MFFNLVFEFQVLAVYDRFGRLIQGHPHVAKDVLEWVTFEKHVADSEGKWRLHDKIIPDWLQKSRDPGLLTHILQPEVEELTEVEEPETSEEVDDTEDEIIKDQFGNVIRQKK